MYFEARMARTEFGILYHNWLKLPEEVRIFQRREYELSLAKEAYWNTPDDEKPMFFGGRKRSKGTSELG